MQSPHEPAVKKGLAKVDFKYKLEFVLFCNIYWKFSLLNSVVYAEGAFEDNRELPVLVASLYKYSKSMSSEREQ